MIKKEKQSKHETAAETHELDDAQLDDVNGGAEFLTGSLTIQENALADVGVLRGFIMKDTVIIPRR